jgi:tight adherence protein B
MRLAAALAAAVFAYLAVGYLLGQAPPRIGWRARPRTPAGPRAQRWLDQAGAEVNPGQFWAVSILGGALAFVVVAGMTGTVTVALLPAVGVAGLPRTYYATVRKNRARQRTRAWPDALRHLAASLATPLSLHQALVALGRTGPLPLRPAFERYARLTAALDQRAALQAVREDLADAVSDRVLDVLIAAVDQGPAIVMDLLADQAHITSLDLVLVEQIESRQLLDRLSARGVLVLPYFLLVVLCASVPDYRAYYGTARGVAVLGVGVALSFGGMAIVRRQARIPGEERVFAPATGEA